MVPRSIRTLRFTIHPIRLEPWLQQPLFHSELVWLWELRGVVVGVGVAAGAITTSTSTSTTTLIATPTSAAATAQTSVVGTSGNTTRDIAAELLIRTEVLLTDSEGQHVVIH